jgi:hypothetical protein
MSSVGGSVGDQHINWENDDLIFIQIFLGVPVTCANLILEWWEFKCVHALILAQISNTHDYDMLVPDILQALLLEKVDDGFDTLPLVAHYCLARCFIRRSGPIEMAQAGDNASAVAAVMSVLRAGTCSYMVISEMGDTSAKELVNEVRSGRVLNTLASMVRRLRDIQRKKTPNRMLTVTTDGDISIDEFDMPEEKWRESVHDCNSELDQ